MRENGTRLGIRKRPRFAVGVLAFALSAGFMAAFGTVPANAVVSSFGGQGARAGEFEEPHGVAVFQETGDIYLTDSNNARIDSFGPEGIFRFAFGWGVQDGKQELETCTTSCKTGIVGGGAGEFLSPRGIAVDNDPKSSSYGDIYVVDSGNSRIQKFDSQGHFVVMFGSGVNQATKGGVCTNAESESCGAGEFSFEPGGFSIMGGGIAISKAGKLFVGDFNRVEKFTPSGAFELEWPIGEGFAILNSLAATESGEILVLAEGVTGIHRYSESGVEVGTPFDLAGAPNVMTLGPNDEVFVVEENGDQSQPHIAEYDPTGTEVSAFDVGTEAGFRGIAFGNTIGRLYVLAGQAVRLVSVPPPGPFVALESEKVSNVLPTTAIANVVVVAEGSATTYHFEYGTTEAYGASTAPAPLPEEKGLFAAEPATGNLTGLTPDTVYHLRAVAENAAAETSGPDLTFKTPPTVGLSGESATHVTPEAARLNVELNPFGLETTYHFEYGLGAYEHSVPVPDAVVEAEEGLAVHSLVVEGLSPDTEYKFRVVASNALGTVDGDDHTFRTEPALGSTELADSRVWEMVSPPAKNGATLEAISEEGGLIQAAEDGTGIAYFGKAPVGPEAEPEGTQAISDSQFVSRRTGPGTWSTKDITTTHDRPAGFHPGKRAEYLFFSADLTAAALEPFGETKLSDDATERTPYLREEGGGYTPMVTAAMVPPGTKFGGTETRGGDYVGGLELVGASPDAKTAVVSSPLALTSELAVPEGNEQRSVYRWSAATRKLQLVSWLPGAPETPAVESGFRASLGRDDIIVRHAVSTDGDRFIYEVETPTGSAHLYLRDMRLGKTVQLDSREDGLVGGGQAEYQDASADGSVIYFTDAAPLTANSTGNRNRSAVDLYRCEVKDVAGSLECNLTDVSVPLGATEVAEVRGNIVGTDESGNLVYFVANGRLAPRSVAGNCPIVIGSAHLPPPTTECNLYVHDATSNETRLVAILAGSDFPDWSGDLTTNLEYLTARVSPNGRYLAFMSQRSLTGYDNRDARSGVPDEEVYEYDAAKTQLTCVSCKRTGRPDGVLDTGAFPGLLGDRPRNWSRQWIAANVPGWTSVSSVGPPVRSAYQARYLENDGRLYFNTPDKLVPADVNGQFDVYEYEPAGEGTCSGDESCVALMSSGQDGAESAFLDADANGSNAFFLTAARLSSDDVDNVNDVYDAHVCVGTGECTPESKPIFTPCEELESCRAAPPPRPAGSPLAAVGEGNVASEPVKPKALTRNQLLAKALRACRNKHGKRRRRACESSARHRYGVHRSAAAKDRKRSAPAQPRRNG
jgi:hypothetical protein